MNRNAILNSVFKFMKKYILIIIISNFIYANFDAYSGYDFNQSLEIANSGSYNMIGSFVFGIQKMYKFNNHSIGYGVEYISITKDKYSEDFQISIYDIFMKWNYAFNSRFGGFLRIGTSNSIDCDILGREINTDRDLSYGFGLIINNIIQLSIISSSFSMERVPEFLFNQTSIDAKITRVNLSYLF